MACQWVRYNAASQVCLGCNAISSTEARNIIIVGAVYYEKANPCPDDWISLDGSCYLVVEKMFESWTIAYLHCLDLGSTPVELETHEEHMHLIDTLQNYTGTFWTNGVYQLNEWTGTNGWHWRSSGIGFTFNDTMWAPGAAAAAESHVERYEQDVIKGPALVSCLTHSDGYMLSRCWRLQEMGVVCEAWLLTVLAVLLVAVCSTRAAAPHTTKPPATTPTTHDLNDLKQRMDSFERTTKATIQALSRQMMLQQLFVEERVRSDGDSGLKQTRVTSGGTRPYFDNTATSGGPASIHEHADYDRTVGMGEFIAVMNGVEFRTRHNDYRLSMPSRTKKDYNAMEEIPFPPVPHSVLAKSNISEQIAEMREYFKAFHDQNRKHRDWSPYFKPVLCYLEGGWTTNTQNLEEPFASDRHGLEAKSWFDLQEKIRYTSYSGAKNNNENFSYLPTTIINVTADGIPIMAQWNYRIACNPVHGHLDLSYFNVVDDLASRMRRRQNYTNYAKSRAARFSITPSHGAHFNSDEGHAYLSPRGYNFGKLDEIMMEIPGKDNYPGHNTDDSFNLMNYRIDKKNLTVMNTARYHRYYKVTQRGAMGVSVRKRGYSDDNMWTAKTTNPKIADMGITSCYRDPKTHKQVCKRSHGRFTYAIPLELIWMTPLSSWNPYNLTIHDRRHSNAPTDHGRSGDLHNTAKAYNGTSFKKFYLTPSEFFEGGEVSKSAADTARHSVGVLDQQGKIQRVTAAGFRIFLPNIHDVGKIRQRYPIMPLHQDGSVTMKNLQALQDITMDMKQYTYMFEKRPEIQDLNARAPDQHYVTSTTHQTPPGMHHHDLYVTAEEMTHLHHNNSTVTVFTTEDSGHQHELELQMHPTNKNVLVIKQCDGQRTCWDHHNHIVYHRA